MIYLPDDVNADLRTVVLVKADLRTPEENESTPLRKISLDPPFLHPFFLPISMTRLGDLLDFGQLFKAFRNS